MESKPLLLEWAQRIVSALHERDPLSWAAHAVIAGWIALGAVALGFPVQAGVYAGAVDFAHRELGDGVAKLKIKDKEEQNRRLVDTALDWVAPLGFLIIVAAPLLTYAGPMVALYVMLALSVALFVAGGVWGPAEPVNPPD